MRSNFFSITCLTDNSGDGGGACDEGPTQQLQQQLIALIPRKRRPKGTGPRALKNTGKSLYKCEQCDYTTSWPSWLRTHQRVHTGERPFACHLCSYTSSQSSNLQQHLKRHSDERPYKCDLCEYSCKRGHQLTTHRRTHFARDLRHLMSLHGVLPSSTSLTVNNFASLTQLNSSDGSEPPPSSLLDYGLPLSLIDVDLAASATRNLISSSSAPTASSVATPTFATAPDLTSRGATILTSTSSASPVSSATVTPASTTCTIAIGPPSPQLSFLAGGPSELTVTNAESQAPSRLPRYSDCIPWMASISSGSLLGMKSMPSMASPRVSDESAPFAEDTDQDPDQDQDQASQSRSDSDESDSESPGTLHIDEPTPADRSCDSIQAREHL
ncbi:zinc finger protein 628-like [Varroa jacobsoni]|uniref:C2H2-type domain-containing protein n=1 Tax=Varroa destructor TaxID=109461 RepID=A0A7M7KV33_VARDE|nr:transcription factor btd-like [Varroa destructor]XP_022671067.1 transcription factor btd-like [Varroa destructor]XP_022689341.1 zinc finger protein 628-like [Varroa jacobsoni]